MQISRAWAMPSKWTFDCKPIRQFIDKYMPYGRGERWADPFAGNNVVTRYANNLAESGVDACDWIRGIVDNQCDGVLFDPPYSMEQVKRSYNSVGIQDWQTRYGNNKNGGFPNVKDEIARVTKPDGYVLSFGWNSNGMGKKRGFKIVEILLVAHGGNHHDTICVAEVKSDRGSDNG